MKISAKQIVLAAVLAASASGVTLIGAQAYQPHMQNALGDLQSARSELVASIPDKGGHRVNAINLVNQAITETQAGIAVGAGL